MLGRRIPAASDKHSRALQRGEVSTWRLIRKHREMLLGQERIARVKNEWGKQAIKISCMNIS